MAAMTIFDRLNRGRPSFADRSPPKPESRPLRAGQPRKANDRVLLVRASRIAVGSLPMPRPRERTTSNGSVARSLGRGGGVKVNEQTGWPVVALNQFVIDFR